MAEKLLTEMNYEALHALLDSYIERSAQQSGEMPINSFLTLLFASLAQRVKQTFEIEGKIVNGQLILLSPSGVTGEIYVQDNQIVLGEQRIIVRLTP